MPIPVKPCEGRFSDELIELISKNRDRSQWANHPCAVCGAMVGATQVKGQWVPEQHWPTVKYQPRGANGKKKVDSNEVAASDEEAVLAETSFQ